MKKVSSKTSHISDVNIHFIKPVGSLIALASLTIFNNTLFISSIGVHRKLDGGLRLTFPTKKVGNQNFEVYHPINRQLSQEIEDAIFTEVKELLGE
jgi:DNA-binding cell septation regulator SpoVG